MRNKNILLLEPGYKNKYPPLGLMKIAQYHRQQNSRHNIVFAKGEDDTKLHDYEWDRIYITTLFSFEWKRTARCIDKAVELVAGKNNKIFVGGISASLMTEEFKKIEKWQGIRFIRGILTNKPALSLQLKYHDFGCRDFSSIPIEEQVPDYSILNDIEYQYPVHDAYFGYASRGCVRKCAFCGVPKLEGAQKDMPPITQIVKSISKKYGEKKDLILMDNNVTAAKRFNEIIAEIRDLGFTPNAKLRRGKSIKKRRVDFNQGVDSRLLARDPNLLKELSTICIDPLRIAFDHLGIRKFYETSVRNAAENGITSLSNYMLYNFHDTPDDLYQRMELNIQFNQELGIRIWSFPMRYQPVNLKDRSHIGKNWNRYTLRSFQVILQATHGVVTGNPKFFSYAFGSSVDKFKRLLLTPHEFIFHRKHYFQGKGRDVLSDFRAKFNRLSPLQKKELENLLGFAHNATLNGTKETRYKELIADKALSRGIKNILPFYKAFTNTNSATPSLPVAHKHLHVPDDIRVEDAGLYDKEELLVAIK